MTVNAGPASIENGLIFCIDPSSPKSYNGTTTLTDLSTTNVSTTLVNGVTYNSTNPKSFTFDGTNDYINTNIDISWNHTNSVSIHLLLKPSSLAGSRPIIGKGPTNWEWQMRQTDSALSFVYWNTIGSHTNGPIMTNSNFFLNTTDYIDTCVVWDHVINKYFFYRNGLLINTFDWINASINQNRTDPIRIGGLIYQWVNTSSYWNGSLGLVRIYNRALSQSEITSNFNATRGRFNINV